MSKPGSMRVAVAQMGGRMYYAVPRILHEAGMLERLFTDCYIGNKPWLEHALVSIPRSLRAPFVEGWLGRKELHIPAAKVTSFDILGLRYYRALRGAKTTRDLALVTAKWARYFNNRVLSRGLGEVDAIWAFDGAALELFSWAKASGLRCILEQCVGPRRLYRRLMSREFERWPGWQPNLEVPDLDDPRMAREEAEWALADVIICGSSFVREGIEDCGGPVGRCKVVPYGLDAQRFLPIEPRKRRDNQRLRVLFAGEVGLRKGAPYLLEALRQVGPSKVEARFAGKLLLDPMKLRPYQAVATFLGHVPRSRMPSLYAWADVLVLPSIFEGSATVLYEALASGCHIVATPNSGIPPGVGMLVQSADVPAIVARLDQVRNWDGSQSGKFAQEITWSSYRQNLLRALRRE